MHDKIVFNKQDFTTFAAKQELVKEWLKQRDTDGLIMCGLNMWDADSRRYWQALYAKYTGKGPMSVGEADKIIQEVLAKEEEATEK